MWSISEIIHPVHQLCVVCFRFLSFRYLGFAVSVIYTTNSDVATEENSAGIKLSFLERNKRDFFSFLLLTSFVLNKCLALRTMQTVPGIQIVARERKNYIIVWVSSRLCSQGCSENVGCGVRGADCGVRGQQNGKNKNNGKTDEIKRK